MQTPRHNIAIREAPTPASEAAARLGSAFRSTPLEEKALKLAVCAYVDEAKRLGWSVERVLAEIKRIASADGSPLNRSNAVGAARRSEALRIANRAVRWCVEYYYWIH